MNNLYRLIFIGILFSFIFYFSCTFTLFITFSLTSCNIDDNDIIGTEYKSIILTFNLDLKPNNIENYIMIEKDNGSKFEVYYELNSNVLTITPKSKWEPYQRYWLKISSTLESVEGKKFGNNFYRVFQSTEDIIPVSANLAFPDIKNGVVNDEISYLQFYFSSEVDRLSVQSSFSISPSTNGYFEWIDNRQLKYHFKDKVIPGKSYTISISGNARDINGLPVKEFSRTFDYKIDTQLPYISEIKIGMTTFEVNEQNFRYENGIYYLDYICEKDDKISFKLNKPVDKSTIKDSISISPDSSFQESYDELLNNVEISFINNLQLGQYYTFTISNNLKDTDGLPIRNSIILKLRVNGPYSKFLELSTRTFNDTNFTATQEGSSCPVTFDNNLEGQQITVDAPQLDKPVKFSVLIKFTNPSYSNPEIIVSSFIQSVFIKKVFPGVATSIPILTYNFISLDQCEITFEINPDNSTYEAILYLKINGGSSGIIDKNKNYLKESIMIYFKLTIQ
ncbi:MAG: Ig-like domain-containing protein [Spirochaetota bacterium]